MLRIGRSFAASGYMHCYCFINTRFPIFGLACEIVSILCATKLYYSFAVHHVMRQLYKQIVRRKTYLQMFSRPDTQNHWFCADHSANRHANHAGAAGAAGGCSLSKESDQQQLVGSRDKAWRAHTILHSRTGSRHDTQRHCGCYCTCSRAD